MKKSAVFFAGLLAAITMISAAWGADLSEADIAAVNSIIERNGLDATRSAPEIWNFATWNDASPRRIVALNIASRKLSGDLDVSALSELRELSCGLNALTSIDVSHNRLLRRLQCSENELTALDVTNNPDLVWLWCYGNEIEALDLSGCPKLETLNCSHNRLSSLDISRCPSLVSVNAVGNGLAALDTSKNGKLTTVFWK